jgi:SSS family solute:Na+ symporter
MVSLAAIDLVIIAAYFAAVLLIGFLAGRRKSEAADFLLAGRSLTLPLFVMTLVSTWYGGILGVGEFSYLYGISNWVVQGLPYYIFAVLFALLLAKRIRATNFMTIPDKLHASYDRKTALLGSLLTFLLMTPAPYILMLAVMLQVVTGWSLLTCVLAGTAVSTIYLATGGFRADVYTDVFEFVMMFIGFGVVIPFAVAGFGGLEFIRENVPPLHLTWHGGNSMQFIAVWFFIALWTLVDPSFHQRCYAARSGKVAQKGILVSIVFWFVFDAMTATAGLYARAVLPQLENPVMAFPMLAEVALPPAAKGLFFVGMLATVMSSLNTLAFVSASTVGRDIVWRLSRSADESLAVRYTRWGLLATAVLSIILTIAIPSVIKLWYTIGTVIIPGLLIPLVTSYFDRLRVAPAFAFATMLAGWLTSLSWLTAGWLEEFGSSAHFLLGVEPMFPGVIASAAVWGMGMWRKQTVNS